MVIFTFRINKHIENIKNHRIIRAETNIAIPTGEDSPMYQEMELINIYQMLNIFQIENHVNKLQITIQATPIIPKFMITLSWSIRS